MRNPDDQAIPIVVNIIAIVNIIVIVNIIAIVMIIVVISIIAIVLIVVIGVIIIVVIIMISANPCPISENLAEFHAINQSKFIITVR